MNNKYKKYEKYFNKMFNKIEEVKNGEVFISIVEYDYSIDTITFTIDITFDNTKEKPHWYKVKVISCNKLDRKKNILFGRIYERLGCLQENEIEE
jgi:hypothetical protein